MSHSCSYNARHVVQSSGRMQVFAQKKISAGEEITITYTGLLTYQPEKQEKLANVWFFTCTCPRCSDPTELGSYTSCVFCPGCPKRGFLLPGKVEVMDKDKESKNNNQSNNGGSAALEAVGQNSNEEDDDDDDLDDLLDDLELNPELFKKQEPEIAEPKIRDVTDNDDEDVSEDPGEFSFYKVPWTCTSCHVNIKGEQVSELLSKTKVGMFSVDNDTVSDHEKFLSATQTMLHPSNYQVIITKRILSQLYGRGDISCLSTQHLERKLSLCRELLDYVGKVDGGFSQFRGLTTWDYWRARRTQIERRNELYKEDEEWMKELRDVLSIVIICLRMENKVDLHPPGNNCFESLSSPSENVAWKNWTVGRKCLPTNVWRHHHQHRGHHPPLHRHTGSFQGEHRGLSSDRIGWGEYWQNRDTAEIRCCTQVSGQY